MFNSKQANTSYAKVYCGRCDSIAFRPAAKVKGIYPVDCNKVAPAHWPSADGKCHGGLTVLKIETKAEREARFGRMCEIQPGSEAYLSQ